MKFLMGLRFDNQAALMQRFFGNGSARVGFRSGVALVVCLLEPHFNQQVDVSALLGWDVLHALLMQVCMLWIWVSYIKLACQRAHVAKLEPSDPTFTSLERRIWVVCGVLFSF